MEKFVFAEKCYSDFKHCEVWKVGIRLENGKMYNRKDIEDPQKAYNYMCMQARTQFVAIGKESKERILEAINQSKTNKAY